MKSISTILGVALLSTVSMLGCQPKGSDSKALDLADMDQSIAPGDDFYQYANGGWLKTAKIPDDRTRYGAFDVLQEQTEERVKDILFRAADRMGDTTDVDFVKIGDFFASGMDTATIEEVGLQPIFPDLEMISTLADPKDLIREIARERAIGGSSPFYVSVEQDSKEATSMILSFYQSGLGMPDRDYYFDESENGQKLRDAYMEMLVKTFELLGKDENVAKGIAKDVFDFEKRLAAASLTRLQYRDPHLVYNKLTVPELAKVAPNIDWDLYFQNLGIEKPAALLVDNPKFFTEVSNMVKDVPINVWADYLTAQFMSSYSSCLNAKYENIAFDFYGRALSGQQVQQPRWKRVMRQTQGALGEAIGKFYVAECFPPEAKQRMQELVQNLRKTYRERMGQLTWMSDETKQKAQEKLDAITVKIGYPDKWRDYSALSVARDSYAYNVRNAYTYRFNRTMAKLGKPIDRTEWFMTPQTVNAYYNPTMNEIVFPAAILQPPFFDMKADDAVNYGGIGVVIGHEITHGFDDQGRQYNKEGNLENWWSAEDSLRFTEYSQLLVDEFNAFDVIDGIHINGKLTLGENLADYGGLTISVHALEGVLANEQGAADKKIDGFTPLQRFFLSYAKIWRNLTRDQELIRRLKDDVHAPGKYRVDGGVYNIDEFYTAFEVNPSSPYYREPAKRPTIW